MNDDVTNKRKKGVKSKRVRIGLSLSVRINIWRGENRGDNGCLGLGLRDRNAWRGRGAYENQEIFKNICKIQIQ